MQDARSVYRNELCFSYVSNEQSLKESKKTIPLIIASKRIKYLGINLTKEVRLVHCKLQKKLKKTYI